MVIRENYFLVNIRLLLVARNLAIKLKWVALQRGEVCRCHEVGAISSRLKMKKVVEEDNEEPELLILVRAP